MSVATGELDLGRRLPEMVSVVDAARQARYHGAAEVRQGLWGEGVDPSILANDCILAGYPLRDSATTNLHMSQRMVQSEPVRLGERLTLRGRVGEVRQSPKGTRIRFDYEFYRADASCPLRGQLLSLRVDRRALRELGAGSPKAIDGEGFKAVAEKHPTVARVTAYSQGFPLDRVHFDPAVAARIGLKAPIAQGLMSLTWMLEALAKAGQVREVDITAEFRQPIFWDDRITVLARGDAEFQIINAEGLVCSVGRLARLGRD